MRPLDWVVRAALLLLCWDACFVATGNVQQQAATAETGKAATTTVALEATETTETSATDASAPETVTYAAATGKQQPKDEEDVGSAEQRTSMTNMGIKEKLFLFAQYSTATQTRLIFSVTSVPLTCISVTKDEACKGRQMRRRKQVIKSFTALQKLSSLETSDTDNLDTSINDSSELRNTDGKSSSRNMFTIWSTAYSTLTVTSIYTNTLVTAKVSAACTIPGQAFPLCAG